MLCPLLNNHKNSNFHIYYGVSMDGFQGKIQNPESLPSLFNITLISGPSAAFSKEPLKR